MNYFFGFSTLCTLIFSVSCFGQNPLHFGSNIRTADPSAHVWKDGRLYIYASHDIECQQDFWMKDWHVFSSDDLKNWTDHGPCLTLNDITWADNYAWAPDCAYKEGKYYFCFPAGTGHKDRVNPEKSTKWMGIGIAVSDSPTGPFQDHIGAPLWTHPYSNDPCLFIDEDGTPYLYAHSTNSDYCVIELSQDMKSVQGDFYKMDMGGYEPKMEGPWIFKRNGMYYYTMPENNRIITYYMANSPKGPWTYKGVIMEEEHGNNHHSIVEFKGQWILFYHRWIDTADACENRKRQRHICAEYLYFNADGTIQPVTRTVTGLAKNSTD
jgi:beta-xylosidase